MAFIGRPTGNIGEWVVAYIDGFGRIEGTIVRRSVVWFAVRVAATSGKLERLAGKINFSCSVKMMDFSIDRQRSGATPTGQPPTFRRANAELRNGLRKHKCGRRKQDSILSIAV